MTLAELDQLNQVEINTTDKTKLVDIQTIRIDPSQSATQRMESYLEQIINPYLFLCGDTAVKVRFNQEGKDLSYKLKNYYINMKKS